MKAAQSLYHGLLRLPIGTGSLVAGQEVIGMIPSNDLYYYPLKLRKRLDDDGYLYFKDIVPKPVMAKALQDLIMQMRTCGWIDTKMEEEQLQTYGIPIGIPFPVGKDLPPPALSMTSNIREAISGPHLQALMRQVYGTLAHYLPYQTLDIVAPEEPSGFRMPSVYMNQGTKLALLAWTPFHTVTLSHGPLCVAQGSNSSESYKAIRETYGQHEVETGEIHGDGSFTSDPNELKSIGKTDNSDLIFPFHTPVSPFATTSFEAGDVVLLTVYTMYSYFTNRTPFWKLSAETRWVMNDDDIGPDKRYCGARPRGLEEWWAHRDDFARYPKSMSEAKRDWDI